MLFSQSVTIIFPMFPLNHLLTQKANICCLELSLCCCWYNINMSLIAFFHSIGVETCLIAWKFIDLLSTLHHTERHILCKVEYQSPLNLYKHSIYIPNVLTLNLPCFLAFFPAKTIPNKAKPTDIRLYSPHSYTH